jgi:hypothetical protein
MKCWKNKNAYAWWCMMILILNLTWEWCWLKWKIMKKKGVTCPWSNLQMKYEKMQIKRNFMNN